MKMKLLRFPLFILMVVLLFVQCGSEESSSFDVIYGNFFVPVQNIYKPSGKRPQPETLEEKALMEYDQKDYPQAALFLGQVEPQTPDIRFYHANALMASQQTKEAIPILEQLLKEDHAYRQSCEWLLALSYLKNNRVEEAANLAGLVAQTPGHPNQSYAQQLLEKIPR
jgi:tetratricopeptide (TPR) repeat protein